MNNANINIYNTVTTLNEAIVTRWATIAADAIANHNGFHVALAGGSTPKLLYQLLATKEIAETLPWQQTHIYFGDERCVAPDHNDSNFNMARQSFLNHVKIPAANIHRVHTELSDPQQAASDYQADLQQHLPHDASGYHFDLVLLGLGPDGHIASLFPETAILQEREKLVDAVFVEKFSSWRISITYPMLEHAQNVLLLVAGSNKAEIVNDVLTHTQTTPKYPVDKISHHCEWHLDNTAAALIPYELLSKTRTNHDQDIGC